MSWRICPTCLELKLVLCVIMIAKGENAQYCHASGLWLIWSCNSWKSSLHLMTVLYNGMMVQSLIMLYDHVVILSWCCYGNSHIDYSCSAFILKLLMSTTIYDMFHVAPSYSHESLAQAATFFFRMSVMVIMVGYLYFAVSNSTWWPNILWHVLMLCMSTYVWW